MFDSKGCCVHFGAGIGRNVTWGRASRASVHGVCGSNAQCADSLPAAPAGAADAPVQITAATDPRPSLASSPRGLRHGPCHSAKAKAGCCLRQKSTKGRLRQPVPSLLSDCASALLNAGSRLLFARFPSTCAGRLGDQPSNNPVRGPKGVVVRCASANPRQSLPFHSAGCCDGTAPLRVWHDAPCDRPCETPRLHMRYTRIVPKHVAINRQNTICQFVAVPKG